MRRVYARETTRSDSGEAGENYNDARDVILQRERVDDNDATSKTKRQRRSCEAYRLIIQRRVPVWCGMIRIVNV